MLTKAIVDEACRRANVDGEFRLAARFWDTSLRLASDTAAFAMTITQGTITGLAGAPAEHPAACEVTAPDVVWAQMLQPVPEPFYHDLYAAQAWHGVRMSGDASLAYYPAMRRFVELLRQAAEGTS